VTPAGILDGLWTIDTAGMVLAAALLGGLGGLAQYAVAGDPTDPTASPWKSALVGAVAAIGALWVKTPATALELVGELLLVGFFGRAVLAVLQTRVTAALERDRKQRAVAVARTALDLAERERRGSPAGAPAPPDPDVIALRSQLAAIERA
jgi:hypothetical protein